MNEEAFILACADTGVHTKHNPQIYLGALSQDFEPVTAIESVEAGHRWHLPVNDLIPAMRINLLAAFEQRAADVVATGGFVDRNRFDLGYRSKIGRASRRERG